MNVSLTDEGVRITQVTLAAAHCVLPIPAGKGGWLKAIRTTLNPVLTTVVDAGGLLIFHNTSEHWEPLELLTPIGTCVTAGGGSLENILYPINKYLPGNSEVDVDFMPYNAQSQLAGVELIWELGKKPTVETFSSFLYPLKANAVVAAARAQITNRGVVDGVIAVPGATGGVSKSLIFQTFPTMTTVVSGGGLVDMTNDAYDITPCEHYTNAPICTGAAAGAQIYPDIIPYEMTVPANSNFRAWLTPWDAQSQTLATGIVWERPYRG
jgi:hypothetical protein